MTDTARHQIESVRATLQSIERLVAHGRVSSRHLPDIKVMVDELRLRIWAVMAAAATGDDTMTLERFRVRRAIESCQSAAQSLTKGDINPGHWELATLRSAALRLAQQIDNVKVGAEGTPKTI